jgi:hypothetical protein
MFWELSSWNQDYFCEVSQNVFSHACIWKVQKLNGMIEL